MSENTNGSTKARSMSVFTMSMLTVAAVLSLRNLPSMADYGWSIIFYLVMACLCFFIPSALVSAELASTYPDNGGVYLWVKQAFGPKWGFVAIFMQWVENLPWFPACLTFVASAIAYVFNPALATNKWFVFVTILVTLWLATFLNFKGMRVSAFLSSSGVLAGTVVPGVVIILMVAVYLIMGDPIKVPFDEGTSLIPDLSNPTQLMLLAGMMVALAGMEMSSVHVTEMSNPSRNFPRAILGAALVVIVLSVAGSLAIAFVVPPSQLSLAAGVCQAFEDIFTSLHCKWLTPIMCFLLAYGAITMVVTWVLGPSKGVLEVAKEGYLPAYWQKRNKNDMPVRILVIQGIISSVLSTAVLFTPTISNAFWLMSALTAQLYMVMYLFMFAAAIRLRYSQPDVKRPYRIPGGKFGVWVISGAAFLVSLISIFCGFIPPSNVLADGAWAITWYIGFLFVGTLAFIALPLWAFHEYEKKNAKKAETVKND
ncbi:MAG: amino acid permease [Victivallaceae bacterium]|nr:amino acid permease [Victivallaceae bacterium]